MIVELRWSLDKLYTSFDSKEFKDDLKAYDKKIEVIKEWVQDNLSSCENAALKIETYVNLTRELYTLYSKLMAYTQLSFSVDTTNEDVSKTLDTLHKRNTELTKPMVKFQKWLGNIDDLKSLTSSSGILKEHSFYLLELANKTKYLLSDEEEFLISKMSNTGSKAWEKLQGMLTSGLLVDIEVDGKETNLPLTIVRNMAYDKDPGVRKKGYEAELKSYEKIETSSAACINGIKGEVITLADMRGYKSPLDETLVNSRMDKDTLDAMLAAMKESLPVFRKYLRKKAEILGHSNGLPFYDIFAPMGKLTRTFTFEEAEKYIVDNFKLFSDELANFAHRAFENNWIDAEPRKGKRGGAFCYNIHPIKESRILCNFTGSFKNVLTLAHELGHGYHGWCLKEESILNSNYPMPLAETASIFCETIVMNSALKDASMEEALTIIESALQGSTQVIVDIYSRFLFESKLFELRKDYSLSCKELSNIMLEAQKEAYGNGLDNNILHKYMWVNKPHYYFSKRNFYNFPYAFGLLFAKGLYAKYLENKDAFVKDYDKFLAKTGTDSIADVAKMMDVDVRSIDFWKSSLRLVEKDIEKFIELADSI